MDRPFHIFKFILKIINELVHVIYLPSIGFLLLISVRLNVSQKCRQKLKSIE